MILATIAFLSQVALVLFPGLVLHRALAGRILPLDASVAKQQLTEGDLLVFGLVPGLALANTVGTLLAIVHLFYWWAYLAVVILLVGWRRREAVATLSALGTIARDAWRSLLRGNLMVVVALVIFLQTAAGLLIESQLPSSNIDVWNHNFPLAQSIVEHHGFVMPQIDNMFYGTYPIFFHMFFAEGLLFVDSVIAAKAANALLYLAFLLSLLGFARNWRSFVAVLLMYFVIDPPFFSSGASDAMTDIGRVCFAALSFVFAWQYLRGGRIYFLFASGLLAGGAIAGKYTELLTPLLIGLSLLPPLLRPRRDAWLAVAVFAGATLLTGIYPYLRNLILLHNPIYPFVFAHPGLSDEYIAGLRAEVFHSLDPTFRTYSQNLFSVQGWRDLSKASDQVFFSHWWLTSRVFTTIAIGLVILRSRALVWFGLWTFAMWIFWYTLGNMNLRWGMTGLMLLSLMPVLVLIDLIDRGSEILANGFAWRLPAWASGKVLSWKPPVWPNPGAVLRTVITVWAIVITTGAFKRVRAEGMAGVFPRWLGHELAHAVLEPGGLEGFNARTIPGYEVYRYIGEHDLRTVLQPFDNGEDLYQAAFNGGKNGHWILNWHRLPQGPSDFDQFIRDNNIRYFVYRKSLAPLEAERLGQGSGNPRHAEIAIALTGYLMAGSRLLLTDYFGWELREIAPDRLK